MLGFEMGEKVNSIKEWVLGIVLLILTPFLLLVGILVALFVKLPIWIYMLYNESWQTYKENKK